MNEAFLHYIWQYQYFDKSTLLTTSGESITVLSPGFRNNHAGPDFLNAKIHIGSVVWMGHVEIHINSSEWIDHRHHVDSAYHNVILHVVWKENQTILLNDRSRLHTLELKGRVSEHLLLNYRKLINQPDAIPCAAQLDSVSALNKMAMIDRAVVERLDSKSAYVETIRKKYDNDWEQTTYHVLGKNFGFKVNSDAFERLTEVMPYKTLLKHSQLEQVEAMLFGQAGLLDSKKTDDYQSLLHREYGLLSKKYSLENRKLSASQWRFLRLRPANFPTIRIAQFAALIASQKNIFSKIVDAQSYGDLKSMFSVMQSPYWQVHYTFDHRAKEAVPGIGDGSVHSLLINSVVPVLVAYGKYRGEQTYIDRAMDFLHDIPPEENAIIRRFQKNMTVKSAADTQGLIELNNNYCAKRRCLDCNIGYSIVTLSGS